MRTEFIALQIVGMAISLAGVACLAALPVPDMHWYNRLAVMVIMGVSTCIVVLVDLTADRTTDPLQFGLGSLEWGAPMIVILFFSLRLLYTAYPEVAATSSFTPGVWLMPVGIAVQLMPPVFGLVGVHLW